MIKKVFVDLISSEILGLFNSNLSFSVLYGDHALTHNNSHYSDVDLLVVTKNDPTTKEILIMKEIHNKLSSDFKYEIDNEVSYESKLVISEKRLLNAFRLEPFKVSMSTSFHIPLVTDFDLDYVNSNAFLDRLFLNILTTKNRLICGDEKIYALFTSKAFNSLWYLLSAIQPDQKSHENILIDRLFAPRNIWYKDYLGYRDCDEIRKYLLDGLAKARQRNI